MSQLPPENSNSQQPDVNFEAQADNSASQNTIQGNQNRSVQGNENNAVLGDGNTVIRGHFNWVGNTLNIIFGQKDSNQSLNYRTRVQQILLKQVSTEVESRINSSLHNRVYVVLDMEQNPSHVENPWEADVKIGSRPKIRLQNTEITTVFDQPDIAGRLVILGQPGAGKTTMLLKLAEELIKRANENPTCPIPVLFSLSAWKKDNQGIKDWLVKELKDKYGVRKDIGKQWIDNQEIIPLLDGLDELAVERQELCVRKINDFLHPETWRNPLVICSRIKEYQNYTTLLELNNSLELYPFTSQKVYQYLQSTENLQLWDSISHDDNLRELAKTPFLLNVIVLSAQEISQESWQRSQSYNDRLNYLFEAYIHRMFKRRYNAKRPKSENTLLWLGWLAYQLNKENKTEFLIENIQPNSLLSANSKRMYFLGVDFLIIVVSFLVPVFFSWISISLWTGNLLGSLWAGSLLGSLCAGSALSYLQVVAASKMIASFSTREIDIDTKRITTFESINWSLKQATQRIFRGLAHGLYYQIILSLFFGLVAIFIILIFGIIIAILDIAEGSNFIHRGFTELNLLSIFFSGILYGIITGVLNFAPIGLISGLRGPEIERKVYPNQGIKKSAVNALIIILGVLLIFELFFGLIGIFLGQLHGSLILGLFLGVIFGIPLMLVPGIACIQHFTLRLILFYKGYIPWDYSYFLDYATNRMFLQQVGGSYRFIHDLLQKHFANKYEENLGVIKEG
jgi:GTPase SAR1 family protein